MQRGHYREIEGATDNPDAKPVTPYVAARPALIVYGKRVGTTLSVCTYNNCRSMPPEQPHGGQSTPTP